MLAVPPEECRSLASHYELLARRSKDRGARKLLFEMAGAWRRMAERDPPRLAGGPEEASNATQARRMAESPKSGADSSWEPEFMGTAGEGFPLSARKHYQRKADRARQMAGEATTRSVRQRLLKLAVQYENLAAAPSGAQREQV